jgi:hypothetical protein
MTSPQQAPQQTEGVFRSVFAGIGSSIVTTYISHPFDLVRCRR